MREDERIAMERDRDRLSQEKSLGELLRDRSPNEMVMVYLDVNDWAGKKAHIHGVSGALIPSRKLEQVLRHSDWDFLSGDGRPSTVEYCENGASRVEYLRFGREDGIEPLVIGRSFHGVRDDYPEISEEFRLFHNLFHDRKGNEYIKIDDSGEEQVVAVVKPNQVKIRLKEIRQFLAVKEMHLSIQFDYKEFSAYTLEGLGVTEAENEGHEKLCRWEFCLGPLGGSGGLAFSRLCGKRLIPPFKKSKSGFGGFEEQTKKYEEFIIGIDDDGDEVAHTSNPHKLANNFGANPDAPHYLTSVSFRKSVLDRYFQRPGKFEVSDGLLRCGSLWSISIDNAHDDKVVAWLGDLGRDLPYQEQLHWKAHNVASPPGVSESYFRQQIGNQPTDSSRSEHVFQRRYMDLQEACRKRLGWRLIRPLNQADEYHLRTIRVPATDEQPEFDQLVQGLAKILIDSLDSGRLKRFIPEKEREARRRGSISHLEAALAARGVSDASSHIAFLRKLQSLRSAASAHRKGDNYEATLNKLNPDGDNLKIAFAGILAKCAELLDYLIVLVERDTFRESE